MRRKQEYIKDSFEERTSEIPLNGIQMMLIPIFILKKKT